MCRLSVKFVFAPGSALICTKPYLSQSHGGAKQNINSKIVSAKAGGLGPTAQSALSLFSS